MVRPSVCNQAFLSRGGSDEVQKIPAEVNSSSADILFFYLEVPLQPLFPLQELLPALALEDFLPLQECFPEAFLVEALAVSSAAPVVVVLLSVLSCAKTIPDSRPVRAAATSTAEPAFSRFFIKQSPIILFVSNIKVVSPSKLHKSVNLTLLHGLRWRSIDELSISRLSLQARYPR